MKRLHITALILALGLFAAACQPATEDLPIGAPDGIAATCLVGTDCNDTPNDALPPPDLVDGQTDEPLVQVPTDGGMTVKLALLQAAGEPIVITSSIIGTSEELRFCDVVAESLPPQCGEPSIVIANPELIDLDDLRLDKGVYWSETTTTLTGYVEDGVFHVTNG
jgi:hypothetical protein